MNTALLNITLDKPITLCEFVETLQENLRGINFGSAEFCIVGFHILVFPAPYIPSLDGYMNFDAAIPISRISFTNEVKPARIEHLLSAARVLFRRGFDELHLSADGHGVLMLGPLK